MILHMASGSGSSFQPEHQEMFLDGYHVGVQDYLQSYQHVPLTTLDIDRFISTTITNPLYPRSWNAGYLAGWLAGMASVEGPRIYALVQAQYAARPGARLRLLEGTPTCPSQQAPSCQQDTGSVPLVIPMEDPLVHTAEHPFCDDPRCSCHDDPESIAQVHALVQQGLFTPQEATAFVAGTIGRW